MPKFSVKKPFTIIVAVLVIIILGVISFTNMTTDLLPKLELPYVMVMTTYPGASPEKIEKTVTKPLEKSLATTSGIKNITSVSQDNASVVVLEFNDGTNMDSAMIEMSGYIDLIKGQFDDMVQSPMLMKINPDMLPIMIASVDADGMDNIELSKYAENEVIPNFERIGGVASVDASGLVKKQIEITIDDDKIEHLNQIMLDSVDSKLGDANRELAKAKAEIADGEQKLTDESAAGIDKIASGSASVDGAVANLNALLSEETTLNANKQAFTMEKQGLTKADAMYTQLDGAIKAMGVMVAAGGGADLGTAGINISAADLTTLQASVQGIIDSGVISDPTQIAAMTQFLAITKANLDQLIAAHNRLPEVDIELRNIETRLMTLGAMKPALQDGLNKATQGYKELESGKINMSTGLTNAQTQLTLAKSELDKATKEFETQRDEALKAADISGVLTADTISQLLTAQNFSMPAGSLTEGEEKYTVKVGDELSDITELENVTLLSIDVEGLKNIRLKDVANVKMTDNSGSGYAKINGNDGIILTMQKQSTFSTASVCNNVKKAINEMQKTNPELHITPLMDQGVYINIVINSVLQNLLMGGVLAVIILFLFLRDIRSTLIIGLSIPISLMFAVVLMYFSGVTLNIISLSGLALGVGMLVDNSIVSIENIYRLYSNGMDKKKAAVAGAKQISGAIIASTLTTVCVFLPIVFTTGITKQLFTDMGLTIAYSLLASLIIALTVVPTLSSMVLSRKAIKEHKIFDKFLNVYQKVLAWVLRFKPVVLVAVLLLFVYSVVAIGSMGTEFIPEAEGTQISATMTMPKGSKHEDLVKMSDTIIERISDIEDINTIGAMSASGGGAMMGMGGGKNSMSYYILLDEDKKQTTTEIATDIQKKIKDLDCTMDIQTSNMDMSMLGGSGIEIVIKGKDLNKMQDIADELADKMKDVEGIAKITSANNDAPTEMHIAVNKQLAAQKGLTVAQVYAQVSAALKQNSTATTLSTDTDDYPVIIVNSTSQDLSRVNLKDYEITLPDNAQKGMPADDEKDEDKKDSILLSDLATITEETGRTAIDHENQVRMMSVKMEIDEEHNIGLVGREVTKIMDNYQAPEGYNVEMKGENETINEAIYNIILMISLAVVFIYMIMVAQFQSLLSPFIVMFTMPLAFTGGLLALQITGKDLSMLAMLGFLILAGIVVNNGIVFVDYVNQLRAEGMPKHEALLQAGRDRMRPILMTALTTILGLSTMAMGIGTGSEMMQPMAIVTIGGLSYATLLTLFVIPCLYDIMSRKEIKKIDVENIEIPEGAF